MSGEKIKVVITGGINQHETIYERNRIRWNLTQSIDGSTSRNRQGEWMFIEDGRNVFVCASGKGRGGSLLMGAEIFQIIDGVEMPKTRLNSKSGKVYSWRQIPENGSVVVIKEPQRFEFSFLEENKTN